MSEATAKGIVPMLGRLFGRKKPQDISYQVYSKFRHFLSDLAEDDPLYENAHIAADLCEAALQTTRKRLVLVENIRQTDERIGELEAYLKLSEEEAARLRSLLTSFVSITKERNGLIYQLTGFDKSLPKLASVLDDAKNAISDIQYAERHHMLLRQDLGYLQGERDDLTHEREMLERSIEFVSKFKAWALGAFFLGMVALTFVYVIDGTEIFIPAAILGLLITATFPLTYLFRRRMKYELKMNVLKQNKAIQLINKKNVVFAYYTNFLNYEYRKYRVRNSQSLKANIKDYEHYKHTTTRIDALRRNMYAIEREITQFLKAHEISNRLSIDSFAHTVNVDSKLGLSKELTVQKEGLERELALLDERHGNTWERLEALIEVDTSDDRIISRLTQLYFDEVDKIVMLEDEDDKS